MRHAQTAVLQSNQINHLLRSLVSGEHDYEGREAAIYELRHRLIDPMLIERSAIITDSHPLKIEAQAVTDSFEAVTNGMDNPDAYERLEMIEESSVFHPWKLLVKGLRAFYEEDYDEMSEHLERIPDGTPPALLVPFLYDVTGLHPMSRSHSRAEDRLSSQVISDNSFLKSTLEQIEETLEAGLEDLFTETAVLALREITPRSRETAAKFAMWCVKAAADHDLSPALFISRLKSFFPQAECYRLTALAMIPTDPDIALLFWIRFLLSRLHEKDISRKETAEAIRIMGEIHDSMTEMFRAAGEAQEPEFTENLRSLLRTLVQELPATFTEKKGSGLPLEDADAMIALLVERTTVSQEREPAATAADVPEKSAQKDGHDERQENETERDEKLFKRAVSGGTRKRRSRSRKSEQHPEQLELFA